MPTADLPVAPPALSGVATDFLESSGTDLLRRWDLHQSFWDMRLAAGLDFGGRVVSGRIGAEIRALTRAHEEVAGVNFASQDHLSLIGHPLVRDAAADALARFGPHAGSPATLQGGSRPALLLEERLADLLGCREATLFPTGWAAGYGAIRVLVRPEDHVLLDSLAHPALQEAAAAATRRLHRIPHGAHEALLQRLGRIRAEDARAGILVVAESISPVDAAVPDLRAIRDGARAHGATLLVSLGHDFGAQGHGGLGFLGQAGLVGEIDVVVGSLAHVFATDGGFVASGAQGLKQALRHFASPLSASCAISPLQAAVALAALGILRSKEGAERRRRLAANVRRLREGLAARAFEVLGTPSAVVPVLLGPLARARLMTRGLLGDGMLVNLVEHPAVARGASRWLLQTMADHTPEQIDRLVAAAADARERLGEAPG